MNLLVTGGYGFIGSNFILYWLKEHPNDRIINVDVCTYAAVQKNLESLENDERYVMVKADICNYEMMELVVDLYQVDCIVNFAAESHNSNSIINPTSFYRTNLLGIQTLMEVTRNNSRIKRIHHISTCEVYGDMPLDSDNKFDEEHALGGNSPYSSSKACGQLAARAYYKTYGIPITISVCSNNYGPYQFPEKLIPLFVSNMLEGRPLTLYAESNYKREWLHVEDHCRAIEAILLGGKIGEIYNIGSGVEKSVEEISDIILKYFNGNENQKVIVPSRPSHDRRYLLDCNKITRELLWKPMINFEDGIISTIDWYVNNKDWWKPLIEKRTVNERKWENV